MAISKKGRRKITVNKNVFFWSCVYHHSKNILTLRVLTEHKSNSQLICNFNYREPWLNIGSESSDYWGIRPKTVQLAIEYAFNKGWQPFKSDKTLILNDMDIELGIRERVKFENAFDEFAIWIFTQPQNPQIKAYNFSLYRNNNKYLACFTGSLTYNKRNNNWINNNNYSHKQKYFELPNTFIKGKNLQKIQKDFAKLVKKFIDSKNFRISMLSKAEVITIEFNDGKLERIA